MCNRFGLYIYMSIIIVPLIEFTVTTLRTMGKTKSQQYNSHPMVCTWLLWRTEGELIFNFFFFLNLFTTEWFQADLLCLQSSKDMGARNNRNGDADQSGPQL